MWGQAQHPQCLLPTHPWECKPLKGPGRPPAPPLINMQCGSQEQGRGLRPLSRMDSLAMEKHTTTEGGRLSLGSPGHTTTERGRLVLGHLYCRESQKHSLQLPEHTGHLSGGKGGASGGKLECHKLQGWERAHSVCQEGGLALTRPLSMCFGRPRSGSCYRDSNGNRGKGRQLSRAGRVNSTLQSVFLLTMELSAPSTHPSPCRIPLSTSPASVPARSMDLTVGEQTS